MVVSLERETEGSQGGGGGSVRQCKLRESERERDNLGDPHHQQKEQEQPMGVIKLLHANMLVCQQSGSGSRRAGMPASCNWGRCHAL